MQPTQKAARLISDVMPMKIEGSENIKDIFSIFHDGGIVNVHLEKDVLFMEVEIQYLAELIYPNFRKFSVVLNCIENIRFSTWPGDLKSDPEVLTDIDTIFKPELEILEGNIKDGEMQIICNQHLPDFDYCGGELYFTASFAEVFDEAGKSYSINELDTLCKEYWDEWANRNKA